MTVSVSDTVMTSVPGIRSKDGVVLNSRLRGFLGALRLRVPALTLVVTSGVRTTAEQASAMRAKVVKGGVGLLDIYGAASRDEIIAGGTGSTAAILATLDKQVARGTYMSRHMRGDALDMRTTGLSSDDLKALQLGVEALGANQLYEKTPPHLHIEDIPVYYAGGDTMAWGGAAVIGLFLVWAYSD